MTPAPGGGTSAPQSFAINNPAQTLTSIKPSSVAIGAANTIITLTASAIAERYHDTAWHAAASAALRALYAAHIGAAGRMAEMLLEENAG